ncbi:hypothetical protein BAG01nite_26890 [Brevibacillus agri]|uniref:Uncharacterized protein n=1 Tax=Brevibacillus agri TaxID=51101 RepID=A0A3M8B9E8_9BACL|nr:MULTISPECIES: hypothetical protein [Brevibacillus]ELK43093.1 hypothetical protein D478_05095 [Brevibacillus agri BAB-2500]EJL43158.1 hypothetical protein PMI08_02702 [Brevibacillus sp. CF112]MBG9566042.1 hypothetical protein [Brevibacillus agri]MBY0052486.1 hypothetical protein [Brevibacillus agri]MCG5250825.1 hypothetical protein [Brevibacillus agri]
MNPLAKKYQQIDDQIVLFNEEYYLSVEKLDISSLTQETREALFNHLYDFDSSDMELEIDVSEEDKGVWYLQLLVPHVLTLPEAAKRRIGQGAEQLAQHLAGRVGALGQVRLQNDEIYEYVKRYNPDLERIA